VTGSFGCAPLVCAECSRAALEIQRRYPPDQWGPQCDATPPAIRECVREYLRGIYRRYAAADQLSSARTGHRRP
jgi:hypothetical protein